MDITSYSIQSEERFGKVVVAQVVNTPGTSIFVESQLPQFVREDHPRFINFLEAYYRWLDEDNNIGEKINKIKEQQDVDLAIPQFAQQFYKEFLVNIPRQILADKKTLLKYIRQFYRAKGTEKSYKLFFRMLLNTRVDFYYPATDILKVSDGKWIRQQCLRIIPVSGTMSDFTNTKIVGIENKISAYVDDVRRIRIDPYSGYELILNTSSITGKFMPNEIIKTEDGNFLARISPIPTSYRFVYDRESATYKTGTGYKIGDTFLINNITGRGARIKVTSIIPTQRIITDSVTTERNGSVTTINLGNKNVTLITSVICANDGGNYVAEPDTTLGEDSDGVVHENVKNRYQLQRGPDGNVFLSFIPYYPVPQGRVAVQFQYGVEEESGSIERMQIINFGMEYTSLDNQLENTFDITLDSNSCITRGFTGSGAEVSLVVGALGTYPGFYANEDGHLSASKVIPDGEYYQQYSYVTITDHSTAEYRDALKNMVHPAGFKFYGFFRQQNHLNMQPSVTTEMRREFKQFPHPVSSGQNPPLNSTASAKTRVAIIQQTVRGRTANQFGPSNDSIFRERFNYKPMERYDASSEVDGVNANYWGERPLLSTQFANTSIQKFMHVVPITLEGVAQSVIDGLPRVSEYTKSGLSSVRGDMIFNSTRNLVEFYDGEKWVEVTPNRRINILPDSVVTTQTDVD